MLDFRLRLLSSSCLPVCELVLAFFHPAWSLLEMSLFHNGASYGGHVCDRLKVFSYVNRRATLTMHQSPMKLDETTEIRHISLALLFAVLWRWFVEPEDFLELAFHRSGVMA